MNLLTKLSTVSRKRWPGQVLPESAARGCCRSTEGCRSVTSDRTGLVEGEPHVDRGRAVRFRVLERHPTQATGEVGGELGRCLGPRRPLGARLGRRRGRQQRHHHDHPAGGGQRRDRVHRRVPDHPRQALDGADLDHEVEPADEVGRQVEQIGDPHVDRLREPAPCPRHRRRGDVERGHLVPPLVQRSRVPAEAAARPRPPVGRAPRDRLVEPGGHVRVGLRATPRHVPGRPSTPAYSGSNQPVGRPAARCSSTSPRTSGGGTRRRRPNTGDLPDGTTPARRRGSTSGDGVRPQGVALGISYAATFGWSTLLAPTFEAPPGEPSP
jgi:hypothetical protein